MDIFKNYYLTGDCELNLQKTISQDWSTRTRKGSNRICRDAFVLDSKGVWKVAFVRNSMQVVKAQISKDSAETLIKALELTPRPTVFRGCYTYRQDWSVIDSL